MIGIVTLNRDTFTNPTLYAIIGELNKKGVAVTLFCNNKDSKIPREFEHIDYADAPNGIIVPKRPKNLFQYLRAFWQMFFLIRKNKIKHLIAVDPAGLVLAGRNKLFNHQLNIHYFSFEIFFNDEITNDLALVKLKRSEIKYSQNLSSIVIQDVIRKQLLVQENKIPAHFHNWHYIPVSPMLSGKTQKKYAKTDFGLKESDTVYIHSGSVADWSGIDKIIAAVEKDLPKNHYIFIHNKMKFDENNPVVIKLRKLQREGRNVLLHDVCFENYEEYCSFLNGFDYGIVIYDPNAGVYTGMNIREIGLSSGKFSSFLSQGIPVLLSPCKTYEDILHQYKIGALISEKQDLSYHINNHTLKDIDKQVCKSFFKDVLEPSKPIDEFLRIII